MVTTRTERPAAARAAAARSGTTTTTYSYFANFAVGLCEGPIGHRRRIWADGKPLDLTGVTMRIYTGGEDQTADPLIVAKEGAGNAPAYRGLAYVVFERLPLGEIRQPPAAAVVRGGAAGRRAGGDGARGDADPGHHGVRLRAGDAGAQRSAPASPRRRTATSRTRAPTSIASLDELQASVPNLERVALVVAWFGTDLRAGDCEIRPGVENLRARHVHGATWSVAGIERDERASGFDGRGPPGLWRHAVGPERHTPDR